METIVNTACKRMQLRLAVGLLMACAANVVLVLSFL